MDLMELKNYSLKIRPEAYALVPFKRLWARDKSQKKTKAPLEFAFVYFYADYKSDYKHIEDQKKKIKDIALSLGLPENYKPDEAVWDAIRYYESVSETPSMRLLEAVRKSMVKLTEYFEKVDFLEVDKSGKPVYDINKYRGMLVQLKDMVTTVDELEALVKNQIEEKGKSAGGVKSKNVFEDD